MFNIGVGPLETPLGRRLARLILRQVDVVTVRDPGSLAQCRSLGIDDTRVHLAADAVFALTPDWLLGQATPRPRRPGEPFRVGLNLNYDIENPDNWDHFTAHLARALRRLSASRSIEIHALPMQSRFKEHHDAAVLRSFAHSIPEIRFVHHEPATHGDAARIIAECDLVIGERFHAIVMASLLGVPSLVLAYDVKVRELSAMLGLERYAVDINAPFSVADLEEPLRHLVDDLDGVQTRVARRVDELHRRTRECFTRTRSWMAGPRRRLRRWPPQQVTCSTAATSPASRVRSKAQASDVGMVTSSTPLASAAECTSSAMGSEPL